MSTFRVPILGGECEVSLPDGWQVGWYGVDHPGLAPVQIRERFARPIGTPRIRELAEGKKTVAIIVDDITRPQRAYHVLPMVLGELEAAGIQEDDIVVVAALGAHRPMTQTEFRLKVGDAVVDRFRVVNPSLYEHQVRLGVTERGTPVEVCREVAEADLRIGVGMVIQHPSAGWSSGAKLILPGVASMETIVAHHMRKYPKTALGQAENEFRHDMEAVARIARLDVFVASVINGRLEPVEVCVGDVVAAHRAACKVAAEVYFLQAPAGVDAAIISGYPMDREFRQAAKALAPGAGINTVRNGGTILFMADGPDGYGYHALDYREGRAPVFKQRTREALGDRTLLVYCPHVGPKECYTRLPDEAILFRNLDEAVAALIARHPGPTMVNIFPHGGISLLARSS